jgi:hypothetical protein
MPIFRCGCIRPRCETEGFWDENSAISTIQLPLILLHAELHSQAGLSPLAILLAEGFFFNINTSIVNEAMFMV